MSAFAPTAPMPVPIDATQADFDDSCFVTPAPEKRALPTMPDDDLSEFEFDPLPGCGKYRIFQARFTFYMENFCNRSINYYNTRLRELGLALQPLCSDVAIGAVEVGARRLQPHFHCFVHLHKQMALSTFKPLLLTKLFAIFDTIDIELGYYIRPSKHYSDDKYSVDQCRAYCIKNGALYQTPVSDPNPKVERGPRTRLAVSTSPLKPAFKDCLDCPDYFLKKDKKLRMELARLYLKRDHDLDCADAPTVTLYEKVHSLYGEELGRHLFPEVYYQSAGLSVRKNFPTAENTIVYPTADEIEMFWIHGPAGAGKTSFINALYPNHYSKNKATAYWEAYNFIDHSTENPHMVVCFNEVDTPFDLMAFSPNQSSFDTIKNVLDIYPFPVEVKHQQQRMIRPRRIFITSNTTISSLMHAVRSFVHQALPNNKFFGIDVNRLEAALSRRVVEVDIDDVLKAYRVKCLRNIKALNIGGIVCESNWDVVRDKINETIDRMAQGIMEQQTGISRIKEDWTYYAKMCQENLKQFRFMTYHDVVNGNLPIDLNYLMSEISYAFK